MRNPHSDLQTSFMGRTEDRRHTWCVRTGRMYNRGEKGTRDYIFCLEVSKDFLGFLNWYISVEGQLLGRCPFDGFVPRPLVLMHCVRLLGCKLLLSTTGRLTAVFLATFWELKTS